MEHFDVPSLKWPEKGQVKGVKGVMENTEVWGVPNSIRKTIFEGCTLMAD